MLDRQVVFLAVKLCLVSVSVVCNSKLGAAYDEHAATKLSDDVSAGFISIDCGASGDYKDNETGLFYEYPGDSYDRIWIDLNFDDWNRISTDSTIYAPNIDDGNYKVPDEVLKTAATSQDAMSPLSLFFNPSDSTSQCYVYFHFTEIQNLYQKRVLIIELNGRNLTEVTLDYLKPTTITPNDLTITGTGLHIFIYAVEGSHFVSDFPPMLNAVEVFVSLELPLSPTYPNDAQSLSNLEAIEVLDLSYNNLTGSIPEFLAQLPNLKVLNLTGNSFTGSVPSALLEKVKDKTLLFRMWNSGILSRKADIYSFGIILFELITGKPVINERGQESPVHILHLVGPLIETRDTQRMVDPGFNGQFNANAAWKMVNIANLCTQRDGDARPGISYILAELKECLAEEMNPGTTCMTDSFMSASSNLPEEPSSDHGLELALIPW
ncbi:hypothetical protein Patl1_33935 [Pistacia atlantica]|uniref:Uncharacterized protein n=1 Tax=Pistacia atlantica TaxID=434234 RepID=A0ACC0ZXR3_9ROSI|nr:hypothetical protein Patl1_33935 [Pistacia atlantica]